MENWKSFLSRPCYIGKDYLFLLDIWGFIVSQFKMVIIERSLALSKPCSHCCQSSSVWDRSDMENRKSFLSWHY